MSWLINAAQVDKFRKNPKNVIVLDASWFIATDGRDAKQEFEQQHIVGARFLDLSAFIDTQNDLPNMLLRDEALINEKVGALGITKEHKIIFYDNSPLHSSCRALWMFKVFGHNPNLLYILDGGYSAWEKYGGKIEVGEQRNVSPKSYQSDYQAHYVRTLIQMKNNLHHPVEQVVDVRHPVRYAGGPEPRMRLRSGHIPGSFSFPYITMFEASGLFKPIDKIHKQFTGIGVELTSPIVTMCGSGVTASILSFVLDLMDCEQHALYDGSWSEWGYDDTYPGEESVNERPVIRSVDV